jgi:cytochrome c-type biogenesis protein CcmH
LIGAAGALAIAAAGGSERPDTIKEQVHEIGETLRCPVCQNLSVADSPSRTAQQMRDRIESGLRAGRTPDEIRSGFVAAYGEWILLSPPKRGIDLLVWIGPGLLLASGIVIALLAVRRWTLPGPSGHDRTEPISGDDRRLLERALAAGEAHPQ